MVKLSSTINNIVSLASICCIIICLLPQQHEVMARLGEGSENEKDDLNSPPSTRRLNNDNNLAPSTMLITEIMYNPTLCSDSQGEWIELFNNGAADIDLFGWSIRDPSSTTFIINSGIVESGSYFVIGRSVGGCDGLLEANATTSIYLNQGGDTITLTNNVGEIVDEHTYSGNDASNGYTTQRQPDSTTGHPLDIWIQGSDAGGSPRGGGYVALGDGSDSSSSSSTTTTRTYDSFELELQCGTSAGYATRFTYELVGPDIGNYARHTSFYTDSELSSNCQQTSVGTYRHPECTTTGRNSNPYCFDRGHLVMANHLDNTLTDIEESNYMTNVLPQATGFNRAGGAWLYTENLIECSRDVSTIEKQIIFGGAIYNDTSNDYFIQSHGIPTPDIFWKVVVRVFITEDGSPPPPPKVMSWILPNHYTTIDDNMSQYLSTINDIESLLTDNGVINTNMMPELPTTYIEETFSSAWDNVLSGCDKSR